MPIIVKIVDPHLENKEALVKIADFLLSYASVGDDSVTVEIKSDESEVPKSELYVINEKTNDVLPADQTGNFPLPPILSLELDAAGYPWDRRIHASTKTKNKNGLWKLKRDASITLVDEVRREYKTTMTAPTVNEPIANSEETEELIDDIIDFAVVMNYATAAIKDKKISQGKLVALARDMGMPNVASFNSRLDLLPTFFNRLKQECGE